MQGAQVCVFILIMYVVIFKKYAKRLHIYLWLFYSLFYLCSSVLHFFLAWMYDPFLNSLPNILGRIYFFTASFCKMEGASL